MSLTADAVRKAAEENRQRNARTVPSARIAPGAMPFLLTFVAIAAVGVFVYLHQEGRIAVLEEELAALREPLAALKAENATLTRDKIDLERRVTEAQLANRQQIDELKGRAKVFQYEKETLASDVENKEKKIIQLEAEIAGWYEREAQLMKLIEAAKLRVSQADADTKAAQQALTAARAEAAEARAAAQRASAPAAPSPAASAPSTVS